MTFHDRKKNRSGTNPRFAPLDADSSHSSKWAHRIWINLLVAVWIGILYFSYQFASGIVNAVYVDMRWVPFAGRAFMAPFVLATILIVMWSGFYKDRIHGVRTFALLTGIIIAFICVLGLANAKVLPGCLNRWTFCICLYLAISHLLFACWGKEKPQTREDVSITVEEREEEDDDNFGRRNNPFDRGV